MTRNVSVSSAFGFLIQLTYRFQYILLAVLVLIAGHLSVDTINNLKVIQKNRHRNFILLVFVCHSRCWKKNSKIVVAKWFACAM